MSPPLNSSYAPPNETANDLWIERSNLNGVALSCVAYGILFCIAVQCFQGLYHKRNRQSSLNHSILRWWQTIYIACILVLATVALGANLKFNEMTFIDYRNYPGGPNQFTIDYYSTPVNMMDFATYTVMTWFADGLVIFRFYIIFDRLAWVLVLPLCIYIGSVGAGIGLLISIANSTDSFWAVKTVKFGIAYWSISAGLNVILTACISARLLIARRRVSNAIDRRFGGHYISVAAMLVESAALYSTWALVFLITYARNSPVQNILLPPLGQVQGIAPLLITLRVVNGNDVKGTFTSAGSSSFQGSGGIPLSTLSKRSNVAAVNVHIESNTRRDISELTTATEAKARMDSTVM
ncbi:hypothetical protein GYMLUDRAFT_49747 [Collybiopsis luxurians FD-317 M1]|uniref:Uncharacterized protein n=1 Tax=Collybiopsis luxurians FD-317 M1 TaxID=944289 RepID=A0A0D0C4M8_9AGAR|nr:hypothetical protein GYMLUDRAFT_49747 [Collybiopsis luxurians FD-317 M1]